MLYYFLPVSQSLVELLPEHVLLVGVSDHLGGFELVVLALLCFELEQGYDGLVIEDFCSFGDDFLAFKAEVVLHLDHLLLRFLGARKAKEQLKSTLYLNRSLISRIPSLSLRFFQQTNQLVTHQDFGLAYGEQFIAASASEQLI